MRLGQLARQLEIKPDKIVSFLEKEKNITIKTHPNSKVEDDLIEIITNKFKPIVEIESEETVVETDTKKAEEQEKELSKKEDEDIIVEPEHIETPKTTLSEPKIVGKIDLPNKKDIQVEIDGVVYDQEFLDQKKKDELKALREQKAAEKEAKKKEEQEKRRKALEQRKVEEERQAMLAQEKHNVLTAEEEKKKQAILKAQEEREKQLEEKKKKRQKEFYQKQVNTTQKKVKKKKKVITETVVETEIANEPKETNLFKRFIKWLNT